MLFQIMKIGTIEKIANDIIRHCNHLLHLDRKKRSDAQRIKFFSTYLLILTCPIIVDFIK